MNSFSLSVVFEAREMPGGIRSILMADAENLVPPRWADRMEAVETSDGIPDALLLVVNGPLSPRLRSIYFNCFRHDVPAACICFTGEPEEDRVVKELRERGRCWSFSTASEGRELLRKQVQEWLKSLRRESFPYPEGKELLDSYGNVDVLEVDRASLEKAREVFARRGFVCLSGALGAGKTTIARKLLIEASREGMNPMEIITRDLDSSEVVRLLTGPEDCAILLDIDTLRRIVHVYPPRLWSSIVSMMVRATESRHRLILATSSPGISSIFDNHGDAHVILPEPSASRKWRLEEGRETLRWFRKLESVEKAELLLLAAFEPIVAEALFRRVFFRLLDRLMVQENGRFPSKAELEAVYGSSQAASGRDPFRRISGSGEAYLTVSDSVMMSAIDRGIGELLQKDMPVVRAFADTMLENDEARVRMAGYFLAGFYESLSDEMRAKLLLRVASEKSGQVLVDVLNMLVSNERRSDGAIVSMCGIMMEKGGTEVRMTVASALGREHVLESPDFEPVVRAAVGDHEAAVRGRFLQDLTMWGVPERGKRYYEELLEDDSFAVRRGLMLHLGARFPSLDGREMEVLNRTLEEGNAELVTTLMIGLLDRRLEDFNQEFNDLLWVLMDRLPPGGKGRLAWRIGARLRFFSPEVRRSLRTDLTDEDALPVTRCMLMNYSSLFDAEKRTLLKLIHERIAVSREFASMVLRYYSIMNDGTRMDLLRTVLRSGSYEGREALSQLICLGRRDLVKSSLEIAAEVSGDPDFQTRAALPFFVLWNRREFGPEASRMIRLFADDPSSYVRRRLVNSIRQLGGSTPDDMAVLRGLASDEKRAVRAQVALALGEFESDGENGLAPELSSLLEDDDGFVRLSAVSGLVSNPTIQTAKLLPVMVRALDDPSSEVRIEAVSSLRKRPELYFDHEIENSLAERFADPDRNVRMEVIRAVTETPGLLGSEIIRRRMPDILLDRLSTGHVLSEELNMARKIQLDLLPDRPPNPERCDIEIFYRPAREVGGDYYDFFELPDGNLGMAVADVAGKGIPAALTMAGLKGNLEAYVQSIYSISEIVQKVNESAVLGEGDPMITGLFYGVLDINTGQLTYVNAGHNPPLLMRRDGEHLWLASGGLILGLSPGEEYRHDSVRMGSGDVLVLYTDGLTEAMNASNREFGTESLLRVVLEYRDLSSHQIVGGILERVNAHSGDLPQSDDQTLVVMKYR